jgi:hypothetical protein
MKRAMDEPAKNNNGIIKGLLHPRQMSLADKDFSNTSLVEVSSTIRILSIFSYQS